MSGELHAAYWAVVPASVRHDRELRPNAKLLYAEISALCNEKGYCWATNEALAELFGISAKTVSSLISQLEDRGYLTVELLRDDKGQIRQRRIRQKMEAPAPEFHPLPKNEDTYPQKCGVDIRLNDYKLNNTPPYPPSKGGESAGDPEYEPERFRQLAAAYPNPGDLTAAGRIWDELRPDEAAMERIGTFLAGRTFRRKAAKPLCVFLTQRPWEGWPDWDPEAFRALWARYPNHKSKQAACKAWDKLKPSRTLMADMARALRWQMESDMWQRGVGIPYLGTWLNQRRWEDEPDRAPEARPAEQLPVWE